MPAQFSITAGIISSLLFQAEARWRLPLQVALRAEAHSRVRSTPADQVHPRGLRTITQVRSTCSSPPLIMRSFSSSRVVARPCVVHRRL